MLDTRPKNTVSVPVHTLALTDAASGARGRRRQVPARVAGEIEGVRAGLIAGPATEDAATGWVTFAPQAAATSAKVRPATSTGPRRQPSRRGNHRIRRLRIVVLACMTPPLWMARSAPRFWGRVDGAPAAGGGAMPLERRFRSGREGFRHRKQPTTILANARCWAKRHTFALRRWRWAEARGEVGVARDGRAGPLRAARPSREP